MKKYARQRKGSDRAIRDRRAVNKEMMQAGQRGLIPWRREEFCEAANYVHQQMRPDRVLDEFEEPQIHLAVGGEIQEIILNRYIPEYHAGIFLSRKYGWPLAVVHFDRLMKAIRFLRENRARLMELALVIPKGEIEEVDGNLVAALCLCPFTKALNTEAGEQEWDFDVEEVLRKTEELQTA